MTTSVLEKQYLEPDRPYSQKELQTTQDSNKKHLRLGEVLASHSKCGHTYLTKRNGRKEKEIIECGTGDTGNCSVCWKLSKTPRHLRTPAKQLMNHYYNLQEENRPYLTFDFVDTEADYYHWLYVEFV
jgi:hypothetical protein